VAAAIAPGYKRGHRAGHCSGVDRRRDRPIRPGAGCGCRQGGWASTSVPTAKPQGPEPDRPRTMLLARPALLTAWAMSSAAAIASAAGADPNRDTMVGINDCRDRPNRGRELQRWCPIGPCPSTVARAGHDHRRPPAPVDQQFPAGTTAEDIGVTPSHEFGSERGNPRVTGSTTRRARNGDEDLVPPVTQRRSSRRSDGLIFVPAEAAPRVAWRGLTVFGLVASGGAYRRRNRGRVRRRGRSGRTGAVGNAERASSAVAQRPRCPARMFMVTSFRVRRRCGGPRRRCRRGQQW
jgi:hypothetical protein